jgi:hypothetical protein
MTTLTNISNQLSRRHFLGECGVGSGKIALASLLAGPSLLAAKEKPRSGHVEPHFPPQVRAVIHLFMAGAPSQLELFNERPLLTRLEGEPLPDSILGDQRYAFIQANAGVLGPRFTFARHGKSGQLISEALPHLATIADDICLLNAVHTDQFNHAPGQIFFNTGFGQPGRPSIGSWAMYALGAETENLPAYIVMNTGGGLSGGSSLYSSGFLPTINTGVQFRSQGEPLLNVQSPEGISREAEADTFRLIEKLNRKRLLVIQDPEIATRIASYEMAARLQLSAPELTDLSSETQETLDLYGCDPAKASFARACLLARRMVQRGVRYINIFHSGWDAHSDVVGNVKKNAGQTDQGSAALIKDLKRLGMLDNTLVVWGGEFGRTPMVETNPTLGRSKGRDHHPQAYSLWMAGGSITPGLSIGKTDDFGFHPTEDAVHVHDVQATILQQLGLDHERLTYHHAGRDFRLTDVHGEVIQKILS